MNVLQLKWGSDSVLCEQIRFEYRVRLRIFGSDNFNRLYLSVGLLLKLTIILQSLRHCEFCHWFKKITLKIRVSQSKNVIGMEWNGSHVAEHGRMDQNLVRQPISCFVFQLWSRPHRYKSFFYSFVNDRINGSIFGGKTLASAHKEVLFVIVK